MSNTPSPDPAPASAQAEAHLQVGVVAERLGLSIRTLHHWDEAGLVSPTARSAGGFRLYTEQDVERLLTVRRMKPLGFSLDEMKQLLASLDLLNRPGVDRTDTAEARTFIAECRDRADENYAVLEERLGWAEEFRDLLSAIDT